MVSSNSTPTGIPIAVISQRSCRAIRKPLLILNVPSRSKRVPSQKVGSVPTREFEQKKECVPGSLIRPFQPTVVLDRQ